MLEVLIVPRDTAASAGDDDIVDALAADVAAVARSYMDAIMPALLSAVSSGELLVKAAMPLLHHVVVALGAAEQLFMK
jgi:hypothetical protein